MERVGFIGLGAMGNPMAWNLEHAGFDLGVYNRTATKMNPFAEEGVDTYDSPAELANDSDVIVTMVTGPDALRDVVFGEEGVLKGVHPDRDQILVDTSTVSREATVAVNDTVREAGGRFVDAPVLGTVGPAEQGELLILAGTDEETLSDIGPLLETFGEVRHVGEVGDGTSMKLTANLLLGVMMEGFSEAMAFAEGQGLALDDVLDVIQNGVLAAPLYDYKGPLVRERDFDPKFPVDLLFKDLNLVLDAGGDTETPLPATSAAREAANATRGLGHGGEDMMALIKHLEAVSGRSVGEE